MCIYKHDIVGNWENTKPILAKKFQLTHPFLDESLPLWKTRVNTQHYVSLANETNSQHYTEISTRIENVTSLTVIELRMLGAMFSTALAENALVNNNRKNNAFTCAI